ncbi:MAG: zinc-dependent metalloprotease [Actinomycetota bacterium]
MGATEVDWSMGSQAARLADWDTALQIGKKVAGPGAAVPAVERARMREDFAELVPHAEELIKASTGLTVEGFRSRAWVMSRGEWIRANLNGLQRLIEPLAARVMAESTNNRASYKRKAMGAQAGALLGYVGKRVLGQYDVFVPPDDEGLLYFVGPNVAEVERNFGLPARDFRLWIAIHEVTHRVQFGAAPWLRDHLAGMIDTYLGSVSLDSKDLMVQLKRAADEAREGIDLKGMGAFFLILTPAQRELVATLQGVMSLLEGHASFVMNEVGREHVADVDRLRRTLAKRRHASKVERSFQRAIGFEQKIKQYDAGERFVREVVGLAGQDGFNLVWSHPDRLPTLAEISDPAAWVARVVE